MYIYRVEDPDTGEGPYRAGMYTTVPYNAWSERDKQKYKLAERLKDTHIDSAHPAMFADCGIAHLQLSDYAELLFAGAYDPYTLFQWFLGFWQDFKDVRYVVKVYDCIDSVVHLGKYQVCFPKAAAKCIDTMTISDFMELVGNDFEN